jgi:2-oxoglutarate ferredoxin oxidoreductase subunit delta
VKRTATVSCCWTSRFVFIRDSGEVTDPSAYRRQGRGRKTKWISLYKDFTMSEQKKGEQTPEVMETSGMDEGEGDAPSQTLKKFKKSYEIDIFRGWCKSCGICAAFCPKHCITLDENKSPVVESSEPCSGCGWCEIHCPDFAISVRQSKPQRAIGEEE